MHKADPTQSTHIVEVSVPKTISGTRRETITLKFRPEISGACIKFMDVSEKLVITSEGRPDRTFSFRFAPGDNHIRQLEIAAKEIEKESQELLTIACFDIVDTPIQEEFRWIQLRPGVGLKDIQIVGPSLNLIWRGVSNRFARFPMIAFVLLLLLFRYDLMPSGVKGGVSRWLDDFEIRMHLRLPYQFSGNWDGFKKTDDGKWNTGSWEHPPNWVFDFGKNGDKDQGKSKEKDQGNNKGKDRGKSKDKDQSKNKDKDQDKHQVLWVRGTGIGRPRLDGGYHHYDWFSYVVEFDLTVQRGQQSLAWVIRASNLKGYYLFQMTLPKDDESGAMLAGFPCPQDCEGTSEPSNGLTVDDPSPIGYAPFEEGETLVVRIVVTGNTFKHCFKAYQFRTPDGDEKPLNGNFVVREFFDPSESYKHGAFGFVDRSHAGTYDGVMAITSATVKASPSAMKEAPNFCD
jgi:hypothetical protein